MGTKLLDALHAYGADVDGAVARFGNNVSMYLKFVYRFPDDKTMSELKNAYIVRDNEEMYSTAHTLKGVAGNLGFEPIFRVTSDMCVLFKRGDAKAAVELFNELERYYNGFCGIITTNKE